MKIEESIERLPETLSRLEGKPFPGEPAPQDDDFSWESWKAFFSDAPERLVHLLCYDYYDCERDEAEQDCDGLFDAYDADYSNRLAQCTAIATARWGEANVLTKHDMDFLFFRLGKPSRPDLLSHTPSILIDGDAMLFSSWRYALHWWQIPGRIAFLHFIGDKGDGDFRFALSAGMLKEP